MAVFRYSEALLLFAIGYECKHNGLATLRGILATEDAIDRSAPMRDELEEALNRLFSAGLLEFQSTGFKLSETGEELYEKSSRDGTNVFEDLYYSIELLNTEFSLIETRNHVSVSADDYRSAYEGYYKKT